MFIRIFGVVGLELLIGKHLCELLRSLSSSSSQNVMLNEILDYRLPPPNCLEIGVPRISHNKQILNPLHVVSPWQLRNQETITVAESEIQSGSSCFSVENHIV